jgi:hypothetical protein
VEYSWIALARGRDHQQRQVSRIDIVARQTGRIDEAGIIPSARALAFIATTNAGSPPAIARQRMPTRFPDDMSARCSGSPRLSAYRASRE